jgi:hypothetical protein
MKKFTLIFLFGVFQISFQVRADSPITSTPFADAYKDIPMVVKAAERHEINDDIAAFLLGSAKTDIKAAVCNALGWALEGKKNAEIFRGYLAKKYKSSTETLDLTRLKADELMCLGYLMVLGDYFNPTPAIPVLELAAKKNPKSYTVNILLALTRSQKDFDSDWCKVWINVKEVSVNNKLKKDMRAEAMKIIMEYMQLYESSCK